MSVILISYDLKAPGRDYNPLYEAIKTYTWCQVLESAWAIDTSKSPANVRDHLKKVVDDNDEVFVVRMRQNWATTFSDQATEWLKSPSRTWD